MKVLASQVNSLGTWFTMGQNVCNALFEVHFIRRGRTFYMQAFDTRQDAEELFNALIKC